MRVVLTVVKGPHEGRDFVFDQHDNFIVGRAKFARFQLSLKDGYISRVHFLVEVNPPQCRLTDMGSTNGTLVNDKPVSMADLNHGDLIGIGKETVIQVSLEDVSAPDVAAVADAPPRLVEPTLIRPAAAPGPAGSARVTKAPDPPLAETGSFHPAEPCPSCGLIQPARLSDSATAVLPPAPHRVCEACQRQAAKLAQPIQGFRLIRELGRGGMGVVYLAQREPEGGLFALKTVTPAVAGSAVQIERFLREARILKQLDHPHIVAFRAVDESSGLLYFAMDFVRGTDASALQKTHGGPLPAARAVDLTCQMLDALAYAHARGFVHRDIKPANLLVEAKGGRDAARLTDFGLARTYQASRLSGLTIQGDMGGTMAYMAPEQITHFREAKPAADQYAAAATLYRFLTDRHIYELPRQGSQQILMILQEPPVPILDRRPDLSPQLAAVIHRALTREPESRFPDIGAFRAALEPFRGGAG